MTVEAHLAALRRRSDQLAHDVAGLTPTEWTRESNCPPWLVQDLAAHIVTSGRGFIRSIERGLAGVVDPPSRGADDFSGADPPTVASALNGVTDRFEALYDGLTEAQLETVCWHRRGNRSVRWYAAHRLAEVAFHGWDLETSLGRSPHFDSAIARLLLPTLLESNVPRTYAAGLTAERGQGERFLLRVADEPSRAWLITINPDVLETTPIVTTEGDGNVPARGGGLAITASAGDLALLVYGRADLRSVADLDGDAALVDRFAQVFPRP
ncbi:MAG: maleylpyruvate isomerase family mycothiol-dependent enzyme [Chloroflexi bacterium]|nr:maleylpyruvate isomerase family mycothiol-dependent enzyme [Chloroflexota bacterium]MBV9133402.1 maleylpyruvate isomerase family mycothiol-dependent enzyme [Chloroflexota bacterium]MBV9895222.1 maleylpyruvate isomerase family mycothiol-dependent enzyme [Chloroflexota bacterium]